MTGRETARVKHLRKMYSIEDRNGTGGWKREHRPAPTRRLKTSEKRLNEVNERGLS
jgi:hypothetical protein